MVANFCVEPGLAISYSSYSVHEFTKELDGANPRRRSSYAPTDTSFLGNQTRIFGTPKHAFCSKSAQLSGNLNFGTKNRVSLFCQK